MINVQAAIYEKRWSLRAKRGNLNYK